MVDPDVAFQVPPQVLEASAGVATAIPAGSASTNAVDVMMPTPAVFGLALKQARERFEAIGQTLGIIEPIDADDERTTDQAVDEAVACSPLGGTLGLASEGARVDADRCGDSARCVPVQLDAGAWNCREAQNRAHAILEL